MAFDQSQASSAVRTLWVGELDSWMDESQLPLMFASEQHNITNIKVIRDRVTQQPSGFGFVEFVSREAAEHALNTLNNQPLPIYPAKKFRLQWAQYGMVGRPESQLHSVYVGDLDHQVTDSMLESTFRARFPSVATARVVTEAGTGKPKGFGFVRFIDEAECKRAVNEMNNVPLCGRPMRVGLATPKPPKDEPAAPASAAPKAPWPAPSEDGADGFNTTVFVGNLSPSVTQELLRSEFEVYGELESVNVPKGKNCGFVTFRTHEQADMALRMLHGKSIGGAAVRLSWGKSAALKRQAQMMPATPYPYGMYPSYPYVDYYNAAAPPMYAYPPAPVPVPQMMPPMPTAIPVQHPVIPHMPAMPIAAPVAFGAQWIAQVDQMPLVPSDPLKLDVRAANARFIRQHSYAVVLPFADSVHFQELVKRSLAQ